MPPIKPIKENVQKRLKAKEEFQLWVSMILTRLNAEGLMKKFKELTVTEVAVLNNQNLGAENEAQVEVENKEENQVIEQKDYAANNVESVIYDFIYRALDDNIQTLFNSRLVGNIGNIKLLWKLINAQFNGRTVADKMSLLDKIAKLKWNENVQTFEQYISSILEIAQQLNAIGEKKKIGRAHV